MSHATYLLLGGYCLSEVRGDAAGLKVGDVNPFINPVLGNGVTWIRGKISYVSQTVSYPSQHLCPQAHG